MNGRNRHLLFASLCVAGLVLLALGQPKAALAGWLAGFVFWGALPIGALCLVMMMRLIPGGWGTELEAPAETAMLLLPLVLLAALPLLVGMHVLYEWADAPAQSGWRAIYLTPGFFALRTVGGLAVFMLLAVLLLARPAASTPISSAGLIVFTLIDTTLAIDWLMSLDPEFHSSGFGLYVLSIQMTIALAMLILVHLAEHPASTRVGLLGGLLLAALLLWAYFAFMQYFIIWSGDLPHGVMWYQRRGIGGWAMAEYLIGALHLAPAFLLFFPQIRGSRWWLQRLGVAVLAGKALECVWLVLPDVAAPVWAGLIASVLALVGLSALSLAGLRWASGGRARWAASAREAPQ